MTGIPYHKMLFFDHWYVIKILHRPSHSFFVYISVNHEPFFFLFIFPRKMKYKPKNKNSNWDDHCGMVAQACTETVVVKDGRGGTQSQKLPVVTHRTSIGLSINEWEKGLDLYRKQAQQYA